MNTKSMLVTRVVLTRFGVRRFEREVNGLLFSGKWELADVSVKKRGLRIVCVAVLKENKISH